MQSITARTSPPEPCWRRRVVIAGGLVAWGGAIAGAAFLHEAQGLIGYSICGPWGCAASTEALVGYHLLLTLLLAPAAVLLSRLAPRGVRRRLGLGVLAAGLVLGGAIATNAAAEWNRTAPGDRLRPYTLQRAAFVVAASPDLPAVPLTLAGLACVAATAVLDRRGRQPPGEAEQTTPATSPPIPPQAGPAEA
ncbi:MAG: hypothetical protein AAF790_10155 [Planctomycetota bacterium]